MDDRERSRATRVRAGRWISTGGLVGLAIAFFLPAVRAPGSRLAHTFPSFNSFPCYFAVAMLFVYLLRALWRKDYAQRAFSHAAAVVTLVTFLWYDVLALVVSYVGGGRVPEEISFHAFVAAEYGPVARMIWALSAVVGAPLAFAIWFAARPATRIPLLVSLTGAATVVYLVVFAFFGAAYGIWVSLASCSLIVVGGLIEAYALRRVPPENALADSPPTR